jgi:hypothetical protein
MACVTLLFFAVRRVPLLERVRSTKKSVIPNEVRDLTVAKKSHKPSVMSSVALRSLAVCAARDDTRKRYRVFPRANT